MTNGFIQEIVSGGQTGVDRAALDVAIELKITHGGWCPYQRKAEDGTIPEKYSLKEAPAPSFLENFDSDAIYKIRTELNAKDSDGTLIITKDDPIGGTLFTIEMLKKYNKPYIIYKISDNTEIIDIVNWIIKNQIHKLNIAGPRASQAPGIYNDTYNILRQVLNHHLLNQNQESLINENVYRAKL